ncbi:hypothetical protein DM860_012335 [Cuscuta australis]|uniref:F-box domain-containing protein n=1 Tax=Cuscuta australis TaxID=267555 RepID=A0A328DR22_9ASTE|nr:hypothetical protein DM860_012335 [Cuscuta australis]
MATATHLPWEIIVDIFCRLPVEDLLRYRAVSKPWRSLIGGREFINRQLKLSPDSTSRLGFFFGGSNGLYWTSLNGLNSFAPLTYPIDAGTGISVHGSCNGLLALMNPNSDMAIWNPSTRRYIGLPISDHFQSFPCHEFEIFLTGFGYDPINDDYKLLLLIEFQGLFKPSFHRDVKIYSLNAKTWKKIDNFPANVSYGRNNGVLFGNSLHWLVKSKPDNSNLILAFDLVNENFREIELPQNNCFCVKLVNLGGSLCAVILSKVAAMVEVWEMKENGVAKESWAIIFSVPSTTPTPPFNYFIPVAYVKNGDQVLVQDSEKLFVFDIKRRKMIKRAVGSGFPKICDALVCMKSLVGLEFAESTWKWKKSSIKIKEKRESGKKRDDFLSKGFKLAL